MKEHRLIGYRASDFGDQTRYNSRTAEANKAAQDVMHQQAFSANQQEAASQMAAPASKTNPLGGQPLGAAYYQQQADRYNVPQQPLTTGMNEPTQAAVLGQARANAQTGATTYNPMTGQSVAIPKASLVKPTATPTSKTQAKVVTGADLQAQAEVRRKERLQAKGIDPNSDVMKLIDQGYKYTGDSENGQAVFIKDGVRTLAGISTEAADRAKTEINAAPDQYAAEIQSEQDAAVMQEKQQARDAKDAEMDSTPKAQASTIDTTAFQQTTDQLTQLMGMVKGLDANTQAAILPQLLQLQNSNAEIQKQVNEMSSQYQTDAELAANAAVQNANILDTDAKYKALIEKNNQTMLEIAKYNKDALEIDKRIMDHDAAVAEQKQVALNVENEKKLRRQLNRLGIQTDLQGLNFLQTEIQKGATALENLKTANNLVSLKAQLAIGEGYRLEVKQAMEAYESNYLNITTQTNERLATVRNSISTAKSERTKGIIEAKKWGLEQKQVNDRETRSMLNNAYQTMQENLRKQQVEDRQKEKDALDRIDYLLNNYPRESVADAIRELGKDVTSFNVQALIDNPTFEELKKAQSASTGRGSYGGYLPLSMQQPSTPSVSFEEFERAKIDALQNKAFQTFSAEKKAQLIVENTEKWQEEYAAIYTSGVNAQDVEQASNQLVQQFGQVVVDAANLVIDGTYGGTNGIKNAAKAFGVSESSLATAVAKLKVSGSVADTAILSPTQQSSRDKVLALLKQDQFYTVYTGAKSAVTRIATAIGNSGGADGLEDIMAINAFQNGIVDPGATVKEGDVTLMQTAVAWSQKVDLKNWIAKIQGGDKLPPEMRVKMLQLAKATRDAYGADFQSTTVPQIRELIKQNGLPSSVLDTYLGTSNASSTVSPQVSKFVDSLPLE